MISNTIIFIETLVPTNIQTVSVEDLYNTRVNSFVVNNL